jgi:hypothetical protein
MAVFTLDDFMAGGTKLLLLLHMAVPAVFPALIFRLNLFPLPFVGLSIPSIHVPPFMDAEILGYDEGPSD